MLAYDRNVAWLEKQRRVTGGFCIFVVLEWSWIQEGVIDKNKA